MQVHPIPAQWAQYVIPAVVVLLLLGLRLWRMRGSRRLRLETLWILPAIYVVFVVGMFAMHPPTAMGFACAFAALVVGAGIGWYRGTMMRISVDPETHALSQQASPLAVLLLFGLIIVRRVAMVEMGDAQLVVDGLLGFALGLVSATRLEMAIRARRLLRESLASTFR